MLRQTYPLAERYITVTPSNTRALNAHDLADIIEEEYRGSVTACGNPASGIRLAMEHITGDHVVCVFGSLYMLGEIREYLLQTKE